MDLLSEANSPARTAALIATRLVGVAFLRYALTLAAVVELSEEYLVIAWGARFSVYIDQGAETKPQNKKRALNL